ncbi:MAG TPA: DUF2844 domain-containing protein [Candidatus Sulfotelmatobacter sp.]|jgi:hypothetical protein|nr:DUF2844 domain-containing protein [Candidatus Sulfotelmatobacter sp.]
MIKSRSIKLKRRAAFLKLQTLVLAALFLFLSSAFPAWATLGGNFASVQSDQSHLRGNLRTTTTASYTVHEIQSASGTMVREYVSPQGKVFAIGWQGPWPPDMRQLLGSYFDQYVQAAKAQNTARVGRGSLRIEQPGLVVHMGGHIHSFVGRAYVPGMLPSGVRAEDIQ